MKLLIVGGAKCGKSSQALREAQGLALPGKRVFVATAEARDEEMARRIAAHQAVRGEDWRTVEEPLDLKPLLRAAEPDEVLLVDCLTLWLNNVLAELAPTAEEELEGLVEAVKEARCHLVLVSNEVGWGIVPENALARRFRDLAGILNQELARAVDSVHFVVAGCAIRLK